MRIWKLKRRVEIIVRGYRMLMLSGDTGLYGYQRIVDDVGKYGEIGKVVRGFEGFFKKV